MKDVIELTKKLIKFKTTKENLAELDKCIEFIKKQLPKNAVIKYFKKNNKPSLIITYTKTKKPDLFLVGHLDVVEANKLDFTPKIKRDKLFGRGAVDMKSGLAVMLVLFKKFSKIKPPIGLMITSDEEIGSKDGAKFLVDKGYSCKYAIAPEPNHSKNPTCLNMTIKEKGLLWLKLKAYGKSEHGSRPWLGENAADKLIVAYSKIKNKFNLKSKNKWIPTISLGSINSADAINKIPDYAEAKIDIRFTEHFNLNSFLKFLKTLDVDFEILDYNSMLNNSSKNKYIQKLKEIANQITKKPVNLIKEHGASDLCYFSEKGIPAVIFGPYGKNYHSKNEYVNLKSLELYYRTMEAFINDGI